MQCPRCGVMLTEGTPSVCPRCGLPLAQQPSRWTPPLSRRTHSKRFVATAAGGVLLVVVIVASIAALIARSETSPHQASLPTATPTPTNIPGPTATPQVFFQDPLTSNTKGWGANSGCAFKNDGLHIADEICFAPVGRLGNVDVKVTARVVSGDLQTSFGIVVRDTSEGANRYDFDMTADGSWAIFRYSSQQLTRLVNYRPSASIHQGIGATNLLEARVVGIHLQFFANGDLLGQTDDSALIDGFIGLLSGNGMETVYSNLEIGVP